MRARLPRRPLALIAGLGLVALVATVQAATPPASATLSAAPTAAPSPPPPLLTAPPPAAAPRAPADPKRMWGVSLSNMVVYENGSGYLYGIWRPLGGTTDQHARLYWGRGCPDISDRVYNLLQTGFSRQDAFFLIADSNPDPRQPGAFCVRGVELEARTFSAAPAPAPAPPPVPGAR